MEIQWKLKFQVEGELIAPDFVGDEAEEKVINTNFLTKLINKTYRCVGFVCVYNDKYLVY